MPTVAPTLRPSLSPSSDVGGSTEVWFHISPLGVLLNKSPSCVTDDVVLTSLSKFDMRLASGDDVTNDVAIMSVMFDPRILGILVSVEEGRTFTILEVGCDVKSGGVTSCDGDSSRLVRWGSNDDDDDGDGGAGNDVCDGKSCGTDSE